MVDWQAGTYIYADDFWLFMDGSCEVIVPGTINVPDPNWLAIAQETMSEINRHVKSAVNYLEAFVDRMRFAPGGEWEFNGIRFGSRTESSNGRFVMDFRIPGDTYGRWIVGFNATTFPPPHDVFPFLFLRQQQ